MRKLIVRRLVMAGIAAAGAAYARRKARADQSERDLWNQATDKV